MRSTRFLIQEHKLILRALDVLDAMGGSAEEGGKTNENDAGWILDFLSWFADAHHQAKEETILFPALKAAAAAQGRPVDHMVLEHDQERALVEQLETDARLNHVSDFVSRANKLSSTLRNHIYKEDEILFEAANQALGPEGDQQVFERLGRFETELDKEILQRKLDELRTLEWKYLRK